MIVTLETATTLLGITRKLGATMQKGPVMGKICGWRKAMLQVIAELSAEGATVTEKEVKLEPIDFFAEVSPNLVRGVGMANDIPDEALAFFVFAGFEDLVSDVVPGEPETP